MTKILQFKKHVGYVLLILGALISAVVCADTEKASQFVENKIPAEVNSYDTELFNLVKNRKNILDNKNYFNKQFSGLFDTLLAQSKRTQTKAATMNMKKRLLSGPAAKARAFKDKNSESYYLYYDACQAHDCEATNLALLFDPHLKKMAAKLTVQGESEFLGNPSPVEKALLNQAQTEPPR